MTAAIGVRVPYITAYDEERLPYRLTFARDREATDGWRLCYADAIAQDWMFGVLWSRQGLHRRGRPLWKLVNTIRQRNAMLRLLCQVCGGSAAGLDGRVSWVLAADPSGTATGAAYTNSPPTCRSCVPEALATCPRLRHGASVFTVGHVELYGVIANVMRPSPERPAMVEGNAVIPLEAFHRLEYALAVQLLVTLRDLRETEEAS